MKILLATTNQGKFKEMKKFLSDLPFQFISLADLKKRMKEPIEDGRQIADNAIIKATYYGEKTGLITLSEDSGLFIEALKGYPGVQSARIGKTDSERRKIILKNLQNKKNRKAVWANASVVYNPFSRDIYLAVGESQGKILTKEILTDKGFGYDPIFYSNKLKKAYSQMTVAEKNSCSHRGKALTKIKYYLQNQFEAKHIVVPIGVLIKNGKMLITKRHDPHRPEVHQKWEMPGGTVDFGQTVESTLLKEIKEETGYKVKIIKQLQGIKVKAETYPNFKYQVFLIPFVCRVVGGKLTLNDNEVLEAKWIKPDDHNKYKFLPGDNQMQTKFLPELKEIIKLYNL